MPLAVQSLGTSLPAGLGLGLSGPFPNTDAPDCMLTPRGLSEPIKEHRAPNMALWSSW